MYNNWITIYREDKRWSLVIDVCGPESRLQTLEVELSQRTSRLVSERYHWNARLRTCRHLRGDVTVNA